MRLLDIIVLSHERPGYLQEMLESLTSLARYRNTIEIKVVDNSCKQRKEIECIVKQAGELITVFKQDPGGSQRDNYMNALDIANAEYLMLVHDDDVIMVNCADRLIESLRRFEGDLGYLDSINMPRYQGSYSTSFCEDNYICPSTMSLRLWPHKLPAFPAWIYRNSEDLRVFSRMLGSKLYGKYSDIPIVFELASKAKRIELIPGLVYCCRSHEGQDSDLVQKKQLSNVLRDYGEHRRVRIFFILLRIDLVAKIKNLIYIEPFTTR